MTLPLCRHRRFTEAADLFSCASPIFNLIDPVPAAICKGCVYPDLEVRPPDPTDRGLCIYRGEPRSPAPKQATSTPAVFTCGMFGRCTVARRVEGLACCAVCPQYRPRDASPEATGEPANNLGVMIETLRGPRQSWPEDWPWWGTTVDAHRRLAREYADSLPLYPDGRYAGRGIVILGGGAFFPGVYVTVRMIRHFGCDLPIEVWHDAEREPVYPHWLEPFGVCTVDFGKHMARHGLPRIRGGWANKFYAVLHSSFEEVLYLDSDCYPLQNVTPLFDENKEGALFWRDLPIAEASIRWHIYDCEDARLPPIQGGHFLLRKADVWKGLLLSQWWNERADFAYRFGWGDQDILRGVFGAGHSPCRMSTSRVVKMRPGLLHFSEDGKTPLFAHRLDDKFRLAGIGKDFSSIGETFLHHNKFADREARPDVNYPGDDIAFGYYREFLTRFRYRLAWFDAAREDAVVFPEVLEQNCYRLPDRLPPHAHVVDVGAHIGSFSVLALSRGARQVWAFEPDAYNWALCKKNLEFFGSRARVHHRAVWSHAGRVGLNRFEQSYLGTARDAGDDVDSVSLDTILAEASEGEQRSVQVLKLDCEGAEWPILMSSKLLHVCEAIVGEYHHATWQGRQFVLEDLRSLLREMDYTFESQPYSVNHGLFWAYRRR